MERRSIHRIAPFLLCAATAVHIGSAQESINNASVSGRVTDPSTAVVEGAVVTARQTETNLSSMATTGRDGRFRFPYLKIGPYEIKVRRQGFADAVHAVTLTVGS